MAPTQKKPLPELPEEIWNLVIRSLADMEHDELWYTPRVQELQECIIPGGSNSNVVLLPAHIKDYGQDLIKPQLLFTASLLSPAFRRLALPYIYEGVVVDLPCGCIKDGMDHTMQKMRDFAYRDLVKAICIRERYEGCSIGQSWSLQARWEVYSSIKSYFPNVRHLHFAGRPVNLHECPASFLEVLAGYASATISNLELRHMDSQKVSGLDLSHVTVLSTDVGGAANSLRIEQLGGVQFKVLAIMEDDDVPGLPGLRTQWLAPTYPGLHTLIVLSTFQYLSDTETFLDFVSRHPSLYGVVIEPDQGEDMSHADFSLFQGLYEDSDPFTLVIAIGGATFVVKRDIAGSSSIGIECSKLSIEASCSGADGFASLLSRIACSHSELTELSIELRLLQILATDMLILNSSTRKSWALLSHLNTLDLVDLPRPPAFPPAPPEFSFSGDSYARDVICFTLQTVYALACEASSLEYVYIRWQTPDLDGNSIKEWPWAIFSSMVNRDPQTRELLSVEADISYLSRIERVQWPIHV